MEVARGPQGRALLIGGGLLSTAPKHAHILDLDRAVDHRMLIRARFHGEQE